MFCPECGAPAVDGLTCWDQLGYLLAWEVQDAELAAIHFLTVSSYNLQHPANITDTAIEWLRAAYIDHLDGVLPLAEVQLRMGKRFAGAQRVLKPKGERGAVLRLWPMTIADVYLPDQPQGAAERVQAWAASIRRELG